MVALTAEVAAHTSAQIPAFDPTNLSAAVAAGFSSSTLSGTQISFVTPAARTAIFGG
jgi:hypothetical protein